MRSSEVVLEVGSEEGPITLFRENADDGRRFWVKTNETTTYEMLSEEDRDGVSPGSTSQLAFSFGEALEQLDRYRWSRFSPILVHQGYRQAVLSAVRTRIGLSKDEESRDALARWITVTGEAVLSVSAPVKVPKPLLSPVQEHHIDFLLEEDFACNPSFLSWFLENVQWRSREAPAGSEPARAKRNADLIEPVPIIQVPQ